ERAHRGVRASLHLGGTRRTGGLPVAYDAGAARQRVGARAGHALLHHPRAAAAGDRLAEPQVRRVVEPAGCHRLHPPDARVTPALTPGTDGPGPRVTPALCAETTGVRPRLAASVRLQWDAQRLRHVLPAPEKVV